MLYFDTNKLSLHIDDIVEGKRNAQKLFDSIQNIKQLSCSIYNPDSDLIIKFQHLIKDSEDLVEYYSKMSLALDQTLFDAVKMITETNRMLSAHLDSTDILVNQSIDKKSVDY